MQNRNKPIAAFSIIELAITIVVGAVVIAALVKANSMFERVVGSVWQAGGKYMADMTPACEGGAIDGSSVEGKIIHIFTTDDTLACSRDIEVEYLIVAGGGGGGGNKTTGGGGGGGFLSGIDLIIPGSYPIIVGRGGSPYSKGQDSSFNSLVAIGGGRGGSGATSGGGLNGGTGGSGGGNGRAGSKSTPNNGTTGQGYTGGAGQNNGWSSGGGGGAGGSGGKGGSSSGGRGGNGKQSDITGTNVWYAAGAPGMYTYYGGVCGGKAAGGSACNEDGAPNTGNGGGVKGNSSKGRPGGSGIVVIRYNKEKELVNID